MKIIPNNQTNEGQIIDISSKLPDRETEIPCFQCGVCCVKWQPLMDKQETERIAKELNITVRTFRSKYTRPYSPRPGSHIMKANEKGCVFLEYHDNKALCGIHAFKPQACIDWSANLANKECRDGIDKMTSGTLPTAEQLYDSPEDRDAFARALSAGV
ncbi:MAG: YkgJ family cysteine cluster protein [Dehalococcoidia bacterium]|nr:YkgJ family cysteine cluster protein [Dehalococcoidia bacterium]